MLTVATFKDRSIAVHSDGEKGASKALKTVPWSAPNVSLFLAAGHAAVYISTDIARRCDAKQSRQIERRREGVAENIYLNQIYCDFRGEN
jgi:hypothetical protein